MDTGFPLVMMVAPLMAAAIAVVLRGRRRATAVLGLVTAALLTTLLWLAAPGEGLFADNIATFYGRDVVLTPPVRALFLFIYPAFGAMSAASWFRPMGRTLIVAGLAALTPLAAVLMTSPMGIGAVWLVVAAAAVTPAIYGGRYAAATSAWRYFLMASLALVPLLITTSPPATGWSAAWIGPLLAVLILLGGFPFHFWVTGLGRHSSPAVLALVLGLVQIVPVVFVLNLLDTVPAARASIEFQTAVRWSAALTALVAVFQMSRSPDWRGIIAGAVTLDTGFLLAASLAPGVDGLTIALPALMSRYVSLLLITVSFGRLSGKNDSLNDSSPVQRFGRALWRALPIVGLLSLAGLPLTPGFAARWAQVAAVGQGGGIWPVVLLVLSLLLATLAAVRATRQWMGESDESGAPYSNGEIVYGFILLGIAVLCGLFPDLLLGYVSRMLGIL